MDEWFGLSGAAGFMPHGHCYLWKPEILWLHIASDVSIAVAYFTIPAALVTFVRRRDDFVFNWIFLMFGAFIFFCGLTHVFQILTTWQPIYFAEGLVKGATALVSIATAAGCWMLLPRAIALPGPGQLAEANERYRALNADLEQRVEERTLALTRSNAELRRFGSFLSHELRQPLNSLSLCAELLGEDPAAAGPAVTERIQRAVGQMAALVEAELLLARAARQQNPERVALGEVAREAREELGDELAAAGAEVSIDPLPTVTGHAVPLRQIFRNLLSNALRYRRPEVACRIRVRSETDANVVRIAVEDNGRGLDALSADRLFEAFVRGTSTDAEGLGLGLAICKRIAIAHGGRIWAEGRPGEGSTFWLELPRGDES